MSIHFSLKAVQDIYFKNIRINFQFYLNQYMQITNKFVVDDIRNNKFVFISNEI